MDEIFMNVQDLELENNKIKQIPFRIDNIIRSYNNIINSLNKEIRYKAGINYDVISISKKLDNCEYNSEQLHLVLTDAIDQYQKTEIEIQKLLKNFQDTTFNNMSGVNNKIKTNIEDILKTKYNIAIENNINQIFNIIPELKENLSFSPYTTTGKIYEIQKFLNEKGYVTDLTGKLDAQTQNSLLLYANFNNSTEFYKVDKITLPNNNFVNKDTEDFLHADGFGNRGDNYYVCNLGRKDYLNLYTVSAEAGYSKVLQKNNIDLSAALGASAIDLEFNSGNIGSKNLYGNANGEVEVLTAEAKGDAKWGRSGYGFSGKAMVAGATGQAKATISIFGIDISLTGEGYAGAFGAGLDVMYEYKNGKREMKFGARASALFGFGGGISISW